MPRLEKGFIALPVGTSNPIFQLGAREIYRWLRAILDKNGYSDRLLFQIQSDFKSDVGCMKDADDGMIVWECPSFTFMVSNEPNSRNCERLEEYTLPELTK